MLLVDWEPTLNWEDSAHLNVNPLGVRGSRAFQRDKISEHFGNDNQSPSDPHVEANVDGITRGFHRTRASIAQCILSADCILSFSYECNIS